jgi:hypothetical protein
MQVKTVSSDLLLHRDQENAVISVVRAPDLWILEKTKKMLKIAVPWNLMKRSLRRTLINNNA